MTWAMVKRYGIELRRYAFNTLSMLLSFYLIFLLLFLGVTVPAVFYIIWGVMEIVQIPIATP